MATEMRGAPSDGMVCQQSPGQCLAHTAGELGPALRLSGVDAGRGLPPRSLACLPAVTQPRRMLTAVWTSVFKAQQSLDGQSGGP